MSPDHTVARTIRAVFEQSALRSERILSVFRAAFCIAIGVRFGVGLVRVEAGPLRHWLTYTALAVAVAFSASVYSSWWRPRLRLLLHTSVTVDAVVCFTTLVPNVLWPGPGYMGIANMADSTALMIMVLGAGLRYSTSAAVLGSVLNLGSYLVLMLIEMRLRGDAVPLASGMYAVFAIYLVTTAAVAVTLSTASRRLALRAAETAVRADWAGRSLGELLHGHHDVRALLGAARLHADLLARDLGRPTAQLVGIAEDLCADLAALHVLVDDIKTRAYSDLLAMEEAQAVEVAEVFGEITALLSERYPAVTVRAQIEGRPRALVAGGRHALRRALFNLVVNACEGDGARGAAKVEVSANSDAAGVHIEVLDDGPGFPPLLLQAGLPSTKPGGTGLGIEVAFAIARASTGAMTVSNRATGGGRVVVALRTAGP